MRNTLALLAGLVASPLILLLFGAIVKPLVIYLFIEGEPSWITQRMLMLTGWISSIFLSWKLVEVISVEISNITINIFFGLWSLFFLSMGLLLSYNFIRNELYTELRWFEIVGVVIEWLLTFGFSFYAFWGRKDIASGDAF